jgi:uncharacterized membrane protein YoaK (UPF0700 family)
MNPLPFSFLILCLFSGACVGLLLGQMRQLKQLMEGQTLILQTLMTLIETARLQQAKTLKDLNDML